MRGVYTPLESGPPGALVLRFRPIRLTALVEWRHVRGVA